MLGTDVQVPFCACALGTEASTEIKPNSVSRGRRNGRNIIATSNSKCLRHERGGADANGGISLTASRVFPATAFARMRAGYACPPGPSIPEIRAA